MLDKLKRWKSWSKDTNIMRLESMDDHIMKPEHYNWVPEVECLDVAQHFNFFLGNSLKYIWRCGRKGTEQDALDDLRKAIFFLNREIERRISEERRGVSRIVDGKEVKVK